MHYKKLGQVVYCIFITKAQTTIVLKKSFV